MPDYQGGSIVNLMMSVIGAAGGALPSPLYPVLPGLDVEAMSGHRNVVLIVIDGMGYDFLCRRAAGGELHRRVRGHITSVLPSTTASAITTFLTAQAPQQHGLTGWFMYFRELAGVFAVLPGKPRCGGVSFSRSGIDPRILFDATPVFNQIARRSIIVTPRRISRSDYNLAHCGRADIRCYDTLDEFFLTTVQASRNGGKARQFIYAYWPDLDSLGHECGIDSVEAASHLAQIDERFGRLCRQLAGSDTFIIATADHGMIDTDDHSNIELADHPDLIDTLLLPLCGERRVAYCYVRQGRAEAFERYVQSELRHCTSLVRSEDLIAAGGFGCGEAHPRLTERVGDYVLLMKENYVLKDWLPGEKRYQQIGVHGGVSDGEMLVPLVTASL